MISSHSFTSSSSSSSSSLSSSSSSQVKLTSKWKHTISKQSQSSNPPKSVVTTTTTTAKKGGGSGISAPSSMFSSLPSNRKKQKEQQYSIDNSYKGGATRETMKSKDYHYYGDNTSQTESTSALSSSISSFQIDPSPISDNNNNSIKMRDHLRRSYADDPNNNSNNEISNSNSNSNKRGVDKTTGSRRTKSANNEIIGSGLQIPSSSPSSSNAGSNTNNNSNNNNTNNNNTNNNQMIEVSKITDLVEQELQLQRDKYKEQLDRKVERFKIRQDRFREQNERLRSELDDARRELEKSKKFQAEQMRHAPRNDRVHDQQQSRIEDLESEKGTILCDLQEERDELLEEVEQIQQQHERTQEELAALKVRVRKDSEKRLSVMECLSTSWEHEQMEAKQKEKQLNSELDIMSKTLKAVHGQLKDKTEEYAKLYALHWSTKSELDSMNEAVIPSNKEEEMAEELCRERESHRSVCSEHKRIVKLKNDQISKYEMNIRSIKSELNLTIERSNIKEESIIAYQAEIQNREQQEQENNHGDADEVEESRKENERLESEVTELKGQVESYLQNMALQKEFCDNLKDRIYKEQETEQEQMEEIHKLSKQIKKQQRETEEKDLIIYELNKIIGEEREKGSAKSQNSNGEKRRSKSSSRTPKKSSMKKQQSRPSKAESKASKGNALK